VNVVNIATGEYVVRAIMRHREIPRPSWCSCKPKEGKHLEWEVSWAEWTVRSWEPAAGLTRLPVFKDYNKTQSLTGKAAIQGACERRAHKAAEERLRALD